MAYSAAMKQAIGAVREQLAGAGFGLADSRFAHHGVHSVDPHAPLVLVACSGGRDSLALAAVAHTVASAWGMRCGAVIVDHGMQTGQKADPVISCDKKVYVPGKAGPGIASCNTSIVLYSLFARKGWLPDAF